MPIDIKARHTETKAVELLQRTPGYQELAKLGQQALDALAHGGATPENAHFKSVLGAIQTIADEIAPKPVVADAGPAPAAGNASAVIAYLAKGGAALTLTKEQLSAVGDELASRISAGKDLAQVALAVVQLDKKWLDIAPSDSGMPFLADNDRRLFVSTVCAAFESAGHDPNAFNLPDVSSSPSF